MEKPSSRGRRPEMHEREEKGLRSRAARRRPGLAGADRPGRGDSPGSRNPGSVGFGLPGRPAGDRVVRPSGEAGVAGGQKRTFPCSSVSRWPKAQLSLQIGGPLSEPAGQDGVSACGFTETFDKALFESARKLEVLPTAPASCKETCLFVQRLGSLGLSGSPRAMPRRLGAGCRPTRERQRKGPSKTGEAFLAANPRSKGILSARPSPVREPSFVPSQVGRKKAMGSF